ncbi:MAG: hypothetical protein VW397_04595, partial [Candidatus Margulisiibacteriota bacterium]
MNTNSQVSAAKKIQSLARGHLARKANQNQTNILRTTLNNWVNEAPNECKIRQRIKDRIQIKNDRLVVDGNLIISSTKIRSLPQDLQIERDLSLIGCTSMTTLPQGLTVGGNLKLYGCTSLRSLSGWVFQLQPTQTVYATNTGLSARLLAEYNNRQNAPGYNGPRINFSINDYRQTSDVRASQLPNLVQTITQTEANHPFWQFTTTQTEQG